MDRSEHRSIDSMIAITVSPADGDRRWRARASEPVTIGLPLPAGMCGDPARLALVDRRGTACALQTRTLDRWPDGSIRWLLVDFLADVPESTSSRYELIADGASCAVAPQPSIAVTAQRDSTIVETGSARFVIKRGGRFPFDAVSVSDRSVIVAARSGFVVEDAKDAAFDAGVESVTIEEQGSVRTTVLVRARLDGAHDASPLELFARLHFFAGSATVKFVATLRNPRRAQHPGNRWTLGDGGSILVRDVSLRLGLAPRDGESGVKCSIDELAADEAFETPFEIYQESSGGDRWDSANHRNRHGQVPHRMRGYRLAAGDATRTGNRATPIVTLSRGDCTMTVLVPRFWQNFPKAIEAARDELIVRLFPRQYPDVHEIQGGEQKTHTFFVAFDRDRVTSIPLDWCRQPLLAIADPSWYCRSQAVPYLTPIDEPDRRYVNLACAAIDGDDRFERKREVIDEYGWRHFGDIYADHEAAFATDPPPIVSHYNNQYDAIGGFAYQLFRSGDPRWWTLLQDLAPHVIDIDTYHTRQDKAGYNHGLFWHTVHYVDAGTSTHRSYPDHPAVFGGGPSSEHNYSTGLLLYYFLTGDPLARETVIDFAQWVLDMDDGRKTIFRWMAGGASGVASATGSPLYHGPGRGAANSIVTLINGHRLTGDARFLAKAEELVRRCVHPHDDLDARQLLDAERRWYYTVFLQALGRFLDYKTELGAIDATYAYGRASLLHYAEWMVAHEYPYLERPEILEYPTETWAAQDMRKSDVLFFAAKHSDGEARAHFVERADFFFRSSVDTLSEMPTRTLTRPVTLMLTNGLMRSAFAADPDVQAPRPSVAYDFGTPEAFVPQRVRAMQRAKIIAGTGAAAASIATLLYLLK
jgi:exo-rhamnogalacturonan lyase-like protein